MTSSREVFPLPFAPSSSCFCLRDVLEVLEASEIVDIDLSQHFPSIIRIDTSSSAVVSEQQLRTRWLGSKSLRT